MYFLYEYIAGGKRIQSPYLPNDLEDIISVERREVMTYAEAKEKYPDLFSKSL